MQNSSRKWLYLAAPLAVVLLMALGWWLRGLVVQPPVSPPQAKAAPTTVTVNVDAAGLGTEETEALVAVPLEEHLRRIKGVERVQSASRPGQATLWIALAAGQDAFHARQLVAETLAQARPQLPENAQAMLLPPPLEIGAIMLVALTPTEKGGVSAIELRTAAERLVRPRMLTVPGVAQVTVVGGRRKQYRILASPDHLASFDITLGELADALAKELPSFDRKTSVVSVGAGRTAQDLQSILVGIRGGGNVLLRDVATIEDGSENGTVKAADPPRPAAVVLAIQGQPHADAAEVVRGIDRSLADLQAALPPALKVERQLPPQYEPLVRELISRLDQAAPPDTTVSLEPGPPPLLKQRRAALAVTISGPDQSELARAAHDVHTRLERCAGLSDVRVRTPALAPRLQVHINRESMARYGVSARQVTQALEVVLDQRKVGAVVEEGLRVDITLSLLDKERGPDDPSLEKVRKTRVRSAGGEVIPLDRVVDIKLASEPPVLFRENGQRQVLVIGQLAVPVPAAMQGEIEQALADVQRQLPQAGGYRIERRLLDK